VTCAVCGGRRISTTLYQPMGAEFWRCLICQTCGHEDHERETPAERVARVREEMFSSRVIYARNG
jgi:hypothetical protein